MGRKRKIPERIYSFIDYDDTIEKHARVFYRAYCPECAGDRGYKRPTKFNSKCADCQTKYMRLHITEESRNKHSKAMMGKVAWNKGKTDYLSDESRKKMSKAKHSGRSWIQNKIRKTMSSLINQKLKNRNLHKSRSISQSLPYSIDELVTHLESLFLPGMTLENHGNGEGKWNIDHKIPDSWFNYKSDSDSDFNSSWSLDNLQPKWFKDNMSKGNRYIG